MQCFFTLLYMKKNDHDFFISLTKKFRSSLKTIDPNLLLKHQFENKPKKLRIGFVSGDLWEHPVGYILLDVLKNLKTQKLLKNSPINVFIGPEGGFTKAEIEQSYEKEFESVSLGKRILRSETAGIVISTSIFYELDDL